MSVSGKPLISSGSLLFACIVIPTLLIEFAALLLPLTTWAAPKFKYFR